MWPGPRERRRRGGGGGGEEQWIETEARAKRGGSIEREGTSAVSGGERAQLMMKRNVGECGPLRVFITGPGRRTCARGKAGRELEGVVVRSSSSSGGES